MMCAADTPLLAASSAEAILGNMPPELVPSGPDGQIARCLLHTPLGAERRPALEIDRERVTRIASAAGEREVH